MWKKLDQLLTRWEKRGFNLANKAHIYSVNFLLLVIAYQGYSFFRDYNNYFLDARVQSL